MRETPASRWRIRLACLLLFVIGTWHFAQGMAESLTSVKEMVVFIRVDDLFMQGTDIKPQEIDSFLDVAEKYGAPVVLATIPMRLVQKTNQNGLMTEQLRDAVRRGHQIAQHGYDHRCPFTDRTDHDLYTPGIEGYSTEERMDKIRKGRKMLEAVVGRRVVSYVAPGGDGKWMGEDIQTLYDMGFIEISEREDPITGESKSHGLCPRGRDYTWQLTEETYSRRMDEAKAAFLEAAQTASLWSILFHDHFTRRQYNGGITLRWFDEFLAWLVNQPGINVRLMTFEQYYQEANPEFSSDF